MSRINKKVLMQSKAPFNAFFNLWRTVCGDLYLYFLSCVKWCGSCKIPGFRCATTGLRLLMNGPFANEENVAWVQRSGTRDI